MVRVLSVFLLLGFLLPAQQPPAKEDERHAQDRREWFYGQRSYPPGLIPRGARQRAILQIQQNDAAVRAQRQTMLRPLSASQYFSITTDSVNWTPIGPRPTDPGDSPTSGRVNSIVLDS